jgi:hypothetical protein
MILSNEIKEDETDRACVMHDNAAKYILVFGEKTLKNNYFEDMFSSENNIKMGICKWNGNFVVEHWTGFVSQTGHSIRN